MKTLLVQPFDPLLRVILLVAPVVAFFLALLNVHGIMGWIVLSFCSALLLFIVFVSSVRIRANDEAIVIWFFPYYKKRIPRKDIAKMYLDDVRPLEDFGGWGVKGNAR